MPVLSVDMEEIWSMLPRVLKVSILTPTFFASHGVESDDPLLRMPCHIS